ncbi:MAG: hypothetical protein AB7I33_15575 [Gemmatimonadales bacterium]
MSENGIDLGGSLGHGVTCSQLGTRIAIAVFVDLYTGFNIGKTAIRGARGAINWFLGEAEVVGPLARGGGLIPGFKTGLTGRLATSGDMLTRVGMPGATKAGMGLAGFGRISTVEPIVAEATKVVVQPYEATESLPSPFFTDSNDIRLFAANCMN